MSDLNRTALMPLRTTGLGYRSAGKTLVEQIDLNIEPGRLTVIMGANGAGKSVLLRLLHGLLDDCEGTVSWNGQSPDELIHRQQAMVFQQPVLLRRSVAANLEFVLRQRGVRAGKPRRQRCQELLEAVGLLEHAAQPARLLSGGEQQRLALARACACEPRVLFLDEPTASLDPASVQIIEQIVLDQQRTGCAVFFVTHDIGQARRLADDIVFLHQGRLAEFTPAEQFFESPRSDPGRAYLAGRLMV